MARCGKLVANTLRSLLALLLAWAAIFAVNRVGGGIGDLLPLASGTPRLAWDLAWVFIAGVVAAWVAVALAPLKPIAHAWVFFATVAVLAAFGVMRMWDEWPKWFSLTGLGSLPLQAWLGAQLGLRTRRAPATTRDG